MFAETSTLVHPRVLFHFTTNMYILRCGTYFWVSIEIQIGVSLLNVTFTLYHQ